MVQYFDIGRAKVTALKDETQRARLKELLKRLPEDLLDLIEIGVDSGKVVGIRLWPDYALGVAYGMQKKSELKPAHKSHGQELSCEYVGDELDAILSQNKVPFTATSVKEHVSIKSMPFEHYRKFDPSIKDSVPISQALNHLTEDGEIMLLKKAISHIPHGMRGVFVCNLCDDNGVTRIHSIDIAPNLMTHRLATELLKPVVELRRTKGAAQQFDTDVLGLPDHVGRGIPIDHKDIEKMSSGGRFKG